MPSQLPYELHPIIIRHVRGKDNLLSLALCCSDFRDLAQSILYKYPAYTTTPQSQRQFLHSIICSPDRLGPMVHMFNYKYAPERPEVPGGTHRDLGTALQAMSNLKQLVVTIPRSFPRSFLEGCTFQLDTFCLMGGNGPLLQYFLPTQPHLRHLVIDLDISDMDLEGDEDAKEGDGEDKHTDSDSEPEWYDEEEDPDASDTESEAAEDPNALKLLEFTPDMCPKLESICGSTIDIMSFFSIGRTVKRLDWTERGYPPAFLTGAQSAELQYLRFDDCVLRWMMNLKFNERLTSLVTLEIVGSTVTNSVIAQHVKFASGIPNLRQVVLSSSWEEDTVDAWFDKCKALKYVDINHKSSSNWCMRHFPLVDGRVAKKAKLVHVADVYTGAPWIREKYAALEYR